MHSPHARPRTGQVMQSMIMAGLLFFVFFFSFFFVELLGRTESVSRYRRHPAR
ncbi:MAG: hypothetical protein Q4P32_11675 [Micrococcales bacterium]|nr:hypothetical protein [Micrococcales bacterium]